MSVYSKDLFGLSKYNKAIARIKNFCANKKVLCAFSGGKDSQCCYHLLKDSGIPFHAEYSITRFEPPELMDFIRANYPEVTFRRAYKMSLIDQITRNGLPTRWRRWCCEAKHKKTPGYDIAVIGIRFAESARRRDRWRDFGRKEDGTWYCCPICDWTTEDVWEYLNSKNIPHCSLYDEGYKRIGCVCCPLSSNKIRKDAKRWQKTAAMLKLGFLKYCENLRTKSYGIVFGDCDLSQGEEKTIETMWQRWLNAGRFDNPKKDEPFEECLFAGTGFSESDAGDAKTEGVDE